MGERPLPLTTIRWRVTSSRGCDVRIIEIDASESPVNVVIDSENRVFEVSGLSVFTLSGVGGNRWTAMYRHGYAPGAGVVRQRQ